MDKRTWWMVLIALVLFQIRCQLEAQDMQNTSYLTQSSADTNITSNSTNPTTFAPSPGGLSLIGAGVGSIFRGMAKGVELAASGLGFLFRGLIEVAKIVWHYLMIAGVRIFHANHKALIVIYRHQN
jgi:hypothetical protein